MDSDRRSVPFDTGLARELTRFKDMPALERALKWRLNRACDEIDRLRETLDECEEPYADIPGAGQRGCG